MRVTDEGEPLFLGIVVKNFDRPPPSVSYADSSPTRGEPLNTARHVIANVPKKSQNTTLTF
jgi:hypothetical protein